MDEQAQRTLAAWVVLAGPFAVLAPFLASEGELTPVVVGLYWFPAVALVVAGVVEPPWAVWAKRD